MTPTKNSGGWESGRSQARLTLAQMRFTEKARGNGLILKQWAGVRAIQALPVKFSPDLSKSNNRSWMSSLSKHMPSSRPVKVPLACHFDGKAFGFSRRNLRRTWESVCLGFGWLDAARCQLNIRDDGQGWMHCWPLLDKNARNRSFDFGLSASCGPTRSCLEQRTHKPGVLAMRWGSSPSVTMWSRCKWSNLVLLKLKSLELTSAGRGESCGKCVSRTTIQTKEKLTNMRSPPPTHESRSARGFFSNYCSFLH